jgi:hypothetical protein
MTPVIVAVIGAVGMILAALIEKGRRENKKDHGNVMDRLDLISSEIRKDIRQVRGDLTTHINGPQHTSAPVPPASSGKVTRRRKPKAG